MFPRVFYSTRFFPSIFHRKSSEALTHGGCLAWLDFSWACRHSSASRSGTPTPRRESAEILHCRAREPPSLASLYPKQSMVGVTDSNILIYRCRRVPLQTCKMHRFRIVCGVSAVPRALRRSENGQAEREGACVLLIVRYCMQT